MRIIVSAFFIVCFCVFWNERIPPESEILQVRWRRLALEPSPWESLLLKNRSWKLFHTSILKCGVGLFSLNHIKGHILFPFWEQNSLMTRKNEKLSSQPALSGKAPGTRWLWQRIRFSNLQAFFLKFEPQDSNYVLAYPSPKHNHTFHFTNSLWTPVKGSWVTPIKYLA